MKNLLIVALVLSIPLIGCGSSQKVKNQEYAKLKTDRTFEAEFPEVWKGIEKALSGMKILERDPEEVDSNELKKLKSRTLETDWIYSQSRDKYHEYKINGSPRKKYLQTRVRYEVEAERSMGGTHVTVKMDEEIEKLKPDGTSAGYEEVDEIDTSRPNELLEKINHSMLSAP